MKDIIYDMLRRVRFIHAFCIIIVGLCFAMLFYMLSSRFPDSKINMSGDIKMAVINLLTAVVMFWVGSSVSSSKKDETVTKLIDQNKTIKDEKNSNAG